MATIDYRNVNEYIARYPASMRPTLRRVRAAIRKAIPRAAEGIGYGIPAYRFEEGGALYFAGWTKHWSLYPASAALVEAMGDALAPYEVEKATIRFPWTKPVPVGLVGRIARFMAREAARGSSIVPIQGRRPAHKAR